MAEPALTVRPLASRQTFSACGHLDMRDAKFAERIDNR
jgi:hypothetical protein